MKAHSVPIPPSSPSSTGTPLLHHPEAKTDAILISPPAAANMADGHTNATKNDSPQHGLEAEQVDLYSLSPEQRQPLYRDCFSNKVEPLSHISEPDECNKWPDLASEILDAYLTYTIFMVQVWPNYDFVNKRFYPPYDPRSADTGKLLLKPHAREKLQGPGEVRRVRFELCTPFHPLCKIILCARMPKPTDRDERSVIRAVLRPHNHHDVETEDPLLVAWLADVCQGLNGARLSKGQTGFTLADLELIASCCVKEYMAEDAQDYERYPTRSEWIDVLGHHPDEQNLGHIDRGGEAC